ncbi:hypothetical protein U1839_22635 [Sphingomonas sp. RT2P30]|uniref:hypothetical protein n=1 Tax=Parasphingomonas halimpatiens TaxID=3096162 RepID=UPI002FC81535
MVAFFHRQRLNLPVAPLAGGLIGFVAAALFALMPTGMLEDMVVDSGIAAVIAAAEPPLGVTARFVLIFLVGGGVGVLAWFALFLLLGSRSIVIQPADASDMSDRAPVLRRADAHPDAPARRPLSAARDLGTPFLDIHAERPLHMGVPEDDAEPIQINADADAPPQAAPHESAAGAGGAVDEVEEQPLPADLDQPLAAFDPRSIRDDPADWFPAPAPLRMTPRRPVFDPGERFDTFDLTPIAPRAATPPPSPFTPAVPPMPRPDPSATIHALLDRLERGVARREVEEVPPPPPAPPRRQESLEETLEALRRLATRR